MCGLKLFCGVSSTMDFILTLQIYVISHKNGIQENSKMTNYSQCYSWYPNFNEN